MKKIFLVDAYSLIYRFYYAFIRRPMLNAEGVNTSAVFGFTMFLRDIIRREQPHYIGVAFDAKGPTFRHEMFPDYKANRDETPEDIITSVPYIKRIIKAMNLPVIEMQGWEADDLIGALSVKAKEAGFEVYMVTPDKDFGQLIQPNVNIYRQKRGRGSDNEIEIVGVDQVEESFGVKDPRLVIDILALWGDASDNIPGVPGIGEVRATRLVNEYGTVEQVMENIDKITGKMKENLIEHAEQLKMAKELATIDINAPVEFSPQKMEIEAPDVEALSEVFMELGFNSFLRELQQGKFLEPQGEAVTGNGATADDSNGAETQSEVVAKPVEGTQGTLFDTPAEAPKPAKPKLTPQQREQQQQDLFAEQGIETIETSEQDYKTIGSAEELAKLMELLGKESAVCFDTETTGLDTFNDRMVGISFARKANEAWYVPLNPNNEEEYLKIMAPLFANKQIAKIGQNIKFDIMVLANAGVVVKGFKYDTMLLHYVIDPESRHGLEYLSRTYLNYNMVEIEKLIGKGAKQITMDMVPVERAARYACEDADITLRLKELLWERVKEEEMEKLYSDIEEPLIDVLAEIELAGVKLDTKILSKLSEELNAELSEKERLIREIADEPEMNVNSSMQLGEALFDKLKIDDKPQKTRTGRYKTDEEYLTSLIDRNPIVQHILDYRGINKLLSTYIDALPLLINSKTGRLHTSYNQAVTATGRLSSSNPNLQNIPIRTPEGRKIRKAFIASDSDHLLLTADYSQVELRLMAHLSEDANLLEAFHQGRDIHSATAALLFDVPLEEVTSDYRRKAKTANFGIIYGISPYGLAQRLTIPMKEASEIIAGYFRSYPGVKTYMDRVIEEAKESGYVETICGRKRWLRDINSRNAHARGLAERNAINAPIQGGAADIMKIAMIDVQRKFKEQKLGSLVTMQVHDELVVDMLRSEQEQVVDIVINSMQNAAKLKVELVVDYSIGDNWLEAE